MFIISVHIIRSAPPQGCAIGPVLFIVYVNVLSYHLSADSPLFADEVTLISPRNRHEILQISEKVSASW